MPPFSNIVQSEARHIAALAGLFERYGVPMPVNPWPGNVPRFASLKDACEAGVAAEIENEQLYQRLLAAARRPDIRAVFERLSAAAASATRATNTSTAKRASGALEDRNTRMSPLTPERPLRPASQ